MQALYENCDGSYSVGEVVGTGLFPWKHGPLNDESVEMRPTIQVRFDGQDSENGERVESLFADDRHLTLGVLFGAQVSALSKHNPEWVRMLVARRLAR